MSQQVRHCQPCDVYFYTQVENYIQKFQNCPGSIKANHKLPSRDDYTKTHPLMGNKSQACTYSSMIQYKRYVAKLITSCEVFINVNRVPKKMTS